MAKTLKVKAQEKKKLSEEINDAIAKKIRQDSKVHETCIFQWNYIDLRFLRLRDLRELKKRLEDVQ